MIGPPNRAYGRKWGKPNPFPEAEEWAECLALGEDYEDWPQAEGFLELGLQKLAFEKAKDILAKC